MHVIFERPKAIHHVLRVGRNERGGVQRATLRPDPILFGTKLTGSEAARPVAGKEGAVSVPQKLEIKRIASLLQGFDGGKDRADVVEDKPNLPDLLSDLRHLWNRFEWSVCTLTSDRALYYGYAAGRKQVMHETQDRLRRRLISDRVPLDDSTHQLDRIAALLAPIARQAGKSCVPEMHPYAPYSALSDEDSHWCGENPFVVMHLSGKYSDKDVNQAVWRAVAKRVVEDGFRIAFTGGGSEKEEVLIKDATSELPPDSWRNFSGKLTFGRTGALLRRASLYIGVDTSATHVAAAVGIKTIALFGPGSISRWDPAPIRGHRHYSDIAVLQRSNFVTILKNPEVADCRQCRRGHLTRCPRSADASLAFCLQTFPTEVVVNEVRRQLASAKSTRTQESLAA